MVYPPGQGKSGAQLMHLWRQYLEQYAGGERNIEDQIVIAAYHSAEILAFLCTILDRNGKYRDIIDQRSGFFNEGRRRAALFEDRLVNATFTIYNHCNTLAHQLTEGNREAEDLIKGIDDQVRVRTHTEDQVSRSASALKAAFPLMSLATVLIDRDAAFSSGIRQVEQRFAAGSAASPAPWPQLVNALYRMVEIMQVLVISSDPDLRGQVDQIAARFQEEDLGADPLHKLRNGFCRFFELAHLLTTHLDEMLK